MCMRETGLWFPDLSFAKAHSELPKGVSNCELLFLNQPVRSCNLSLCLIPVPVQSSRMIPTLRFAAETSASSL